MQQAADDLDALDIELAREAKRRMEDPDDETIPYEQAMAELFREVAPISASLTASPSPSAALRA